MASVAPPTLIYFPRIIKHDLLLVSTHNLHFYFDLDLSLDKSSTVSSVLQKTHKTPDSYVKVFVGFGTEKDMLPLSSIMKKVEQNKPRQRVTYKMIMKYVEDKYSFRVHSAYIAEVKRGLGLPMYDAPNAVEVLKHKRKHPNNIQVGAIKDALSYFEII